MLEKNIAYDSCSIIDKKQNSVNFQICPYPKKLYKLVIGRLRVGYPANTVCLTCGAVCAEAHYRGSYKCCKCDGRVKSSCYYCSKKIL